MNIGDPVEKPEIEIIPAVDPVPAHPDVDPYRVPRDPEPDPEPFPEEAPLEEPAVPEEEPVPA